LQEVGLEILVAHGGSVSRDAGGRHGSLRAGEGAAQGIAGRSLNLRAVIQAGQGAGGDHGVWIGRVR
jgi:hypothetical protein